VISQHALLPMGMTTWFQCLHAQGRQQMAAGWTDTESLDGVLVVSPSDWTARLFPATSVDGAT